MTNRKPRPMACSVLLAPWLDGPVQRLQVVHRSRLALSLADRTGRVAFSVTFPSAVRLPYACVVASPASTSSSFSVGDGGLAWGDDERSRLHYRPARWWTPARPRAVDHPRLTEAVDARAVRRLSARWPALLGRGPGLTPYGDDVLCGALVALHAAGHDAAVDLAHAVSTSDLDSATTATSAALLRAACEGWCIDELAHHLRALNRSEDPAVSRSALLRVGATSGSGLLAGVAWMVPGLERREAAA